MCIDPASIMIGLKAVGSAVTSSLAGTLGTVATVGGGVLSAYSTLQSGKAAAAAANETAAQMDREALQAQEAADREEMLMRRRFAQQEGGNKVALAGSGVDVNSGAAIELLRENRTQFEEDARVIRTNAQRSANSLGMQARSIRQEGANTKFSSKANAFGTILGTASRMGDRYAKYAGQERFQRGVA